jgi:Ca2+-binding RTX toxin-like protein
MEDTMLNTKPVYWSELQAPSRLLLNDLWRYQNGDDQPNTIVGDWSGSPVLLTGADKGGLYIHAGGGTDTVFAGFGDDQVWGEGGEDYLWGQDGNDTIYGGYGLSSAQVDPSKDVISGGAGNDKLYGQEGDDFLVGGTGADQLWGGSGADTFIWNHVNESGISYPAYLDKIEDFNPVAGDKINVSNVINDRPGTTGLTFIGEWTQPNFYDGWDNHPGTGEVGWQQLGPQDFRILVDLSHNFSSPDMSFLVHTDSFYPVPNAAWFVL